MVTPKDGSPGENQQGRALMVTPAEKEQKRCLITGRTFIAAGIIIALLIGIAAVFLASSDPDGLESTALLIQGQKTLTGAGPAQAGNNGDMTGKFSYPAPMPDYSFGLVKGPAGGIIAMVAGTLLAFLAVFGSIRLMKIRSRRRKRPQDQEP